MTTFTRFQLTLALAWFGSISPLLADDTNQWIRTLQQVTTDDQKMPAAVAAAQQLQKKDNATKIVAILEACDQATPLGKNWLCGVANTLYRRSPSSEIEGLRKFVEDQKHDGEARNLVFTWLTKDKPEERKAILAKMLDDRSPELRFAATAQALEECKAIKEDSKRYLGSLQKILTTSRHPDQVNAILKSLKEAGDERIPADHFGFLKTWQVAAPFDNREQEGFDVEYPIEKDLIAGKFDSKKQYPGKAGEVAWQAAEGDAEEGAVDLNPLFKNDKGEQEKGAIAYAYTTYNSKVAKKAEIRLGCINANKVWWNGKLIISNEVYHASMAIDQYIAEVDVKAGKNELVVKVCQNEQTEPWAQRWTYQLRVCDETGKALPAESP